MKDVYITKVASYLPNNPIENDQMESFIGFIGGKPPVGGIKIIDKFI